MDVFSERMKQLRIENGLTQQEVADVLEIDRKTVTGYESSGRMPQKPQVLIDIANLFDTTIDYLYGATDKVKK
ncbi:helix-turn-helix domain-containing protein [Thermoactinomyces sp. DSM 45892]|uniref:helix-turn-helix domain-containing protein n=1 Tax=Thermoactinomyces sp. DSM 45892 TaxID=1882753 RepID=UPI000899B43C|nr:helix-turn-helix transcriptional regulator [Thermoactinomyces sp. DSM 45892]SDY70948.1 Helix-turn-helix [Thermoactinomyces sp. DSM 45892]